MLRYYGYVQKIENMGANNDWTLLLKYSSRDIYLFNTNFTRDEA